MLPLLIPISSLLISDAFLLIGHGLLLTLLPITASELGFSDLQVAFTGSAYFLGFVSGCLVTPHVLRRAGHIRSFAVLGSIYSVVVLVFGWMPGFFAWLLLRFMIGAAISGLYMIIESWLNERAEKANRGTILSIYSMLNMLMITLGNQLLYFNSGSAEQLFALAAIFIVLAIIPVSLTLALAPAPVRTVKVSLPTVWRHSHIGLIGAVVSGMVSGAFWALAPVYARDSGFDNTQLAALMSATIMGGAVFQVPLGRLSDRYDRRLVLMYAALAGSLISIAFFISSYTAQFSGWIAAILAFFWGGMCMTLYAICLAHANDNAEGTDFVGIGSSLLITLGVSSALGAPIASLMMSSIGPQGLYLYMAVILSVFAVIILFRRRSHVLPDVPASNDTFHPVAGMTTQMLYEMDPRSSDSEAVNEVEIVRPAKE